MSNNSTVNVKNDDKTNVVDEPTTSRRTHLDSDLYLSYLLDGGPAAWSCSNGVDHDHHDHYIGSMEDSVADDQSDGQYFTSSEKGEMDLIEMVTSYLFSKDN